MYCPQCGSANKEGSRFCERCGGPLGQPSPQTQPLQPVQTYQPPARTDHISIVLIVVVVAVALVVVAAAVAMLALTGNGSHLTITHFTNSATSSLSFVMFVVTVSNTGSHAGSATIHCTVTYGNGDSYSASQRITLDAGQSNTYTVTVVTSLAHIGDTSATFSCTL
jgi:uncharacterized membrane protein YvbJ